MVFHVKTVLLCISFYLVNKADSLTCYDCFSFGGEGPDQDCLKNANQTKYEIECTANDPFTVILPFAAPYTSRKIGLKGPVPTIIENIQPKIDECWSLTATVIGHPSIARLCGSSTLTKEQVQTILDYYFWDFPISIHEIHRCKTDKCNFAQHPLPPQLIEPITPVDMKKCSVDSSSMPSVVFPTDTSLILLSWINSLFLTSSLKL